MKFWKGRHNFSSSHGNWTTLSLSTRTPDRVVIIPPGYGHITINPSPGTTLVLANLVSTAFESEYGEDEALHGAAYYVMSDGRIAGNRHYPDMPPVRRYAVVRGRGAAGRPVPGRSTP